MASERTHDGAGLGLTVARHLTHLMGGRIGVDSVPGEGSTFWLELPLHLATMSPARDQGTSEREAERRERMRLETLSRLAHQLSGALTPEDIGGALEDQVLNEAGANALCLALVSSDGRTLELVTMSGYPQMVLDHVGAGIPLSDRTVATDVARSGRPIEIGSAEAYEAAYPETEKWLRLSGNQALVGWPLADHC